MKKEESILRLSEADLNMVPDIVKPLLDDTVAVRSFRAGEIISGSGEDDDQIRFVISGEAGVWFGRDATGGGPKEFLGPGDVFGDLTFLTGKLKQTESEVKALSLCEVLEVPVDRFQRVLREDPEFTVSLLKSLSKRLGRVNLLRESGAGFDLLHFSPVRYLMRSSLYPVILQGAFVPIFLGVLLFLFLGPPDPSKNIASTILWGLAWPGMVVAAFFGARTWCSVCAIGAMSKLVKRVAALDIPFPESLKLRGDFLIAGGILAVIWIECATGIRDSPFNLGLLLLGMFLVALVCSTLFARQAYCRYMCPLGGMAGLLARTSVIELRADRAICLTQCSSHECYQGTVSLEGCPFGQVAATLHSNQFCKICANCLKNCPHDAIRLNLRLPGSELWEARHVRTGTGFLVLGLMGGWMSDMITRLPTYEQWTAWLPGTGTVKFTIVFIGLVVGLNLICMGAAALSHRTYKENLLENYARFALTLLPLTCMGFLAFHAYYLIGLFTRFPVLLNQGFGIGMFGDTVVEVSRLTVLCIQYVLLGVGLVWTLVTTYRLGRTSRWHSHPTSLGTVPHMAVALICTGILAFVMKAACC